MSSNNISGMFKSLKTQVKTEVGKLVQPRPGTQQQRPPQPYGQQQQQQQQQYSQGTVYTAGSQPQQSQHYAQVQYQTQPQQQQLQNIQYVSSPQIQQQYPQLAQGQIYSPTPQPQTQSQFQTPQTNPPQAQLQQYAHTPQSQAVTSPHQMQAQFQPQYQVQQSAPVVQNQQFSSPAPVFQNQSPGQFQSSAPQIQQNSQIYQQPPVTYSPAPSDIQDPGRRQSQIIDQPQQFQSQATNPLPYQNVSQASLQQTPPQTQVQSPVASLARLSIYNQSPVQQQESMSNVTSPQNYQPVPPMGPPPSHLIQSPPPTQYINQPQATQQHQYTGSPLPAITMTQTQQQVHQQFAPQQQQIYNQILPTGSPVPQVNQYQPVTQQYSQQIQPQAHTPSPTQIVSQPNRQSQQYMPSPMQTPVQTPTQPLQYSISPGQASVQQIQPQYNTPSPQAYQATLSSVSNTYSQPIQTSSPVAQFQQVASPIQQSSPQNSSPQSQFHSQVRNSIRRKPHPGQSPTSPQLSQASPQPTNSPHTSIQNQILPPPAEYHSQSHSNTPPIQAQLTSPPNDPSLYHSQIQGGTPPIQAQLTSPPNDPSLYQFHTQEQPVELSAQPEHQDQSVPVQQTTSIQSQNVPAAMDPPQIESEFKSIETVAPKPIHPPAPIQQYAPSPPPSQMPPKETTETQLEAAVHVSDSSIPPVLSRVNQQDANLPQAMGALVISEPIATQPQIQPINAQSGVNSESLAVQTQSSQFPEQESIKPLPHYQAFSPSSQLQPIPQSENMPTQFQGPDAYPIHPEGQHQYQPYSPVRVSQPSDSQGYFPPNQPQAPPGSQSTNIYQAYAPNIATENRVPIPPSGPPPLHLQNQTPPPGFGPRETQMQSQIQESIPTEGISQPQDQPQEVSRVVQLTQDHSNLPPCSGKNPVLTKYTKFYVPTSTLVPRLDPSVQELSHAICEACYKAHLSPIPSFSATFDLYNSLDIPKPDSQDVPVPSSRAICQFGLYPSLVGTFHDHCIPQNSLTAFTSSIQKLNSLPPCPGNDPMDGGEYYTSLAISGSSFCARCFDSYIKPSPFGSHFTMKLNGPGQKWTCDNGRNPGFPSRLLEAHLKKPTPDFNSFAQELRESLQVLPCAGVGNPLPAGPNGEIIVYSMPGTDMTVCLGCFYSRIKVTTLQQHFALVVHDPNTTAISCDLASGVSKFLFMVALKANDIQIWQQSLQKFNHLPKCEGIKGVGEEIVEQQNLQLGEDAKWYHVTAYPNIEACPSCFHTIITPLGASHLFTPITRQLRAGIVRTCNFSVGNGGIISSNPEDFPNTLEFRGFILRHLLEIAWESNHQDFAPFLFITKSLSECAPPCGSNARGYKSPNGRRWFGHVATNAADDNDTTIVMCQECYETHVKDTCLGPFLGRDLTAEVYANDVHNQKEAFCGPFSKVSKGALMRARDENDWTVFARHWNNRQRIRDATLPLIKMLQVEFESQNLLKMSAMQSAMLVQGGASISEVVGTDGYNHGNSVVGYGFQSSAGVDAAMWKKDADNTKWGDASHVMKIAMLESQWKEVE